MSRFRLDSVFPSAAPGRLFALAAALILSLAACDETVDPLLRDADDPPFTMWGVFNAKTDTHAVRLFVIEDQLRLVSPDPIDAVVTSTLLDTGERRVWADSVVQLRDRDFRHVFWSVFPTQPGQRFRIEAARSDGRTSWAELTIPPPIQIEVIEPDSQRVLEVRQYVHILGDPPALPRVDLTYRIVSETVAGTDQTQSLISVPYAAFTRRAAAFWEVEVDLRRDYETIFARLDLEDKPTDVINVFELRLDVHVGDDQWVFPTEQFDPQALIEPGVFTNVENGFGFVGAGYVETVRWRPPEFMLERAGFNRGSSSSRP